MKPSATAPANRPAIGFTASIFRKSLLKSASSGNMSCPSWTTELASRMPNGIAPFAYSVTKIKWGPDSGIKPTSHASKSRIHWPCLAA